MQRAMLSVSSTAEIMITGRWRSVRVLADEREHLVAVELGHEHVEQDDVEGVADVQLLPAAPAVDGGDDLVAEPFEVAREQPAVDRIVVYDQQPGGMRGVLHVRAPRRDPLTAGRPYGHPAADVKRSVGPCRGTGS